MAFHVPEDYRVRSGRLGTTKAYGNNGLFIVPAIRRSAALRCVASDGTDWEEGGLPLPAWEHVSVSTYDRCPTWEELCRVKGLFWDAEDCVVQFHPPRSEYVNNHPYTLHLWRPVGVDLPRPPAICVGTLA